LTRHSNNRDDNETIKKGEAPAGWSDKKKAHKDIDARWTKKNNTAFYGYKNHVNIDRKHKLIRKYKVTDASVHVITHPHFYGAGFCGVMPGCRGWSGRGLRA